MFEQLTFSTYNIKLGLLVEACNCSLMLQEDMVCLSCTATGERVCLAAEGFGNRHCFLENIADKVSG